MVMNARAGDPLPMTDAEMIVLAPVEELAEKIRDALVWADGRLTLSQVFAAVNSALINTIGLLPEDERPLSIIALEANAHIAQNSVIGHLLKDVKPS